MSIKQVTRSVWGNPGNRGRRLYKTLAAVRWQFQKRIVRSPRTIMLANGVRFRAYPDCVVSSALIYADWPEFHELRFVRKQLCPTDLVVDVGANVGHVSLLLADIVGAENLVAFEPTPVTYARLVENWQLNGWQTDRLYQAAVGATAGKVCLRDVPHPLTTNAVGPVLGPTIEVPLVSLDDFRADLPDRRIGLLKIDVEGYESKVFGGCRRLLSENRPRLVMFESLQGHIDAEIATVLADAGYASFELNADGRPDFARATAQNQFAVPAETIAHLER
ncbi:MAG TPA: FkbM family methyltransferase [Pirellulales bacterium]|nr:FkbM family methyltransferase [Pirellulales bacterium]